MPAAVLYLSPKMFDIVYDKLVEDIAEYARDRGIPNFTNKDQHYASLQIPVDVDGDPDVIVNAFIIDKNIGKRVGQNYFPQKAEASKKGLVTVYAPDKANIILNLFSLSNISELEEYLKDRLEEGDYKSQKELQIILSQQQGDEPTNTNMKNRVGEIAPNESLKDVIRESLLKYEWWVYMKGKKRLDIDRANTSPNNIIRLLLTVNEDPNGEFNVFISNNDDYQITIASSKGVIPINRRSEEFINIPLFSSKKGTYWHMLVHIPGPGEIYGFAFLGKSSRETRVTSGLGLLVKKTEEEKNDTPTIFLHGSKEMEEFTSSKKGFAIVSYLEKTETQVCRKGGLGTLAHLESYLGIEDEDSQ